MSTFVIELPYHENSHDIFAKLKDLPWAIFFDSCYPYNVDARFDILSALPQYTLLSHDGITQVNKNGVIDTITTDPFTLIKHYLTKHTRPTAPNLPFVGGAMGYFSYDLARQLETLPNHSKKDIPIAEMAVGIYDWAIVVDHQQQKTYLINGQQFPETESILEEVQTCLQQETVACEPFKIKQNFATNLSEQHYYEKFNAIQEYILAGDCYQINLARRFEAKAQGDPWHAYCRLRQINPAPYSVFFKTPEATILSLSPERFIQVNDHHVETKPIKGTRPRHSDTLLDKQFADALMASEKDHAENIMIVDLLRNDIGKVCEYGSIKVPQICSLESHPSVHHLVSTITGKLAANYHALDLLRASFPGGSITGAPKIRAMEIIDELEPVRRNIYCGSLAYMSYCGRMDTNIAIRTLLHHDNTLYCSAGGAIVADSDWQAEYQETYDKVTLLLRNLR